MGPQFPDQESNLSPLYCKADGSPRKSQEEVLEGNKQVSLDREEGRDHTGTEVEENRDFEEGWGVNTVKDKEGGK